MRKLLLILIWLLIALALPYSLKAETLGQPAAPASSTSMQAHFSSAL